MFAPNWRSRPVSLLGLLEGHRSAGGAEHVFTSLVRRSTHISDVTEVERLLGELANWKAPADSKLQPPQARLLRARYPGLRPLVDELAK